MYKEVLRDMPEKDTPLLQRMGQLPAPTWPLTGEPRSSSGLGRHLDPRGAYTHTQYAYMST